MIGSPFFTTKPEEASGITRGVLNNRFMPIIWEFAGILPGDIRYKLMMSYSLNYGTHSIHFINKNGEYTTKPQFSWGLELIAPDTKLPFHTALNVGFDKGDLLKNSFGIMLKIFKTGFF